MAEEIKTTERKKGGAISQSGMYQHIAAQFPKIYEALEKGLYDRNSAVRVGAAKVLLNKILPDLKSVEVQGGINDDGTKQPVQLLINTGSGFIPATIGFNASPKSSDPTEPTTVQDTDLASESTQDDNSDIRDSETGSS